MKVNCGPYLLSLLAALTSCHTSCRDKDVVCETYVHRYGVPLAPEDWSARGQHGQIVSTRKDGVIVCRSYEGGVLHGETNYTFPHRDAIERREYYESGVLAHETWNYSNGMPQRQVIHSSPQQSTNVVWYENGAPQCKEEYENGQLIQGEYFDFDNQLESQVNEGNGVRTRRDGYGQLLSVDAVQDGYINLRTTYHANGAPESITPYEANQVSGLRKTFLPSGEPVTIEKWSKNCQHGQTIVFQNGEKFAEVPYRYGKKQGTERRYREGENLVEEVSWVQDQQHGPCYSYVGGARKTSWYVQGREVNKASYDAYQHQR